MDGNDDLDEGMTHCGYCHGTARVQGWGGAWVNCTACNRTGEVCAKCRLRDVCDCELEELRRTATKAIKGSELEAMIAETRAENAVYLAGRSAESVDVGYKAAMYSMRALVRRLYKAGHIHIEEDEACPDLQPRKPL